MSNSFTSRPASWCTPVFGRRGRTLLPLVAVLAVGGSVALVGWRASAGTTAATVGARAVAAPMTSGVSDTVVLYGPRQFPILGGGTGTYAERFEVETSYPNGYTLLIHNGAADGTGKVDSALVILNSQVILGPTDFAGGPAVLTRPVTLTSVDTLVVSLWGSADAFLDGSIFTTPDPSFTIYGPQTVAVVSGSRASLTDSFPLPAEAKPPYRLHLVNGDPDGSHRVSDAVVTLNGVDVVQSREIGRTYENVVKDVDLLSENHVTVKITSNLPAHVSVWFTATDSTPPVLTITTPTEGAAISDTAVQVAGTIQDATTTQVVVNGVQAEVTNNTSYAATVPLPTEGANALHVTATDAAGNQTDSTRNVIRDTEPPVLTVNAPTDGFITNQTSVTVSGSVMDATAVTVNANGVPLPVDGSGQFTGSVALNEGANYVTVTATDAANNQTTVVRVVTRDTQAPVLTVTQPADGAETSAETITASGTVQDATAVTLTVNGQPFTVAQDGSFSGEVPLVEGPNTITFVATDAASNSTTVTRTVTRTTAGLPPDPSTVAPPLDQTVATTTFAATEFLYTGANPIQTGVDSGTIAPVRVAVLRGRVLDRAGQPISGVTVTILNHPELGQTLSRADGAFDLAVNGGGDLTVNYQKTGLLPVQRTVDTPWQDYLPVDDVVMIALDTAVTTIDFTQPIEVARGTPQTDSDGTRQATLLFKQGTTAEMVMPDGSAQPLTSLHVRATEYTVGPSGPQAMPAELPPTSAFTYAVELSADEAVAAGAREVTFSQPVSLYVENFLGFPVGTAVPMGSYDATTAAWVPQPNGRVVKIVSVTNGLADLDITGDDVPDDASVLGVTDAERGALAAQYAVGQVLWRAPISHFSPWDGNYSNLLPPDAQAPKGGGAKTENKAGSGKQDDPCHSQGSIIECQNQVLGERLAIVGTPFTLNYRSDRVPGRVAGRELLIPLTSDTLPPGITAVFWRLDIAGRVFGDTLAPAPDLTAQFVWDGKDAYGRVVQGLQPATLRVAYVYPSTYEEPAPADPSFGLTSGDTVSVVARAPAALSVYQQVTLGTWDARALGLGGWTLDTHHAYDPIGGVLYLGDGSRRSANTLGATIRTIAGTGVFGDSGDGGPATSALISGGHVAVAPDGTLYIADGGNNKIRRVTRDGIITTFAGTGVEGFSGDGGPATAAQLDTPLNVAVGPDGSVYISDQYNNRLRRVTPDGIIETIAGNGVGGYSGDGGPALVAELYKPQDLLLAPDGALYVADYGNKRVRWIAPDGIIQTVAGNGSCCYSGDGGPATAAGIGTPTGIALAADGTLYIAEPFDDRVRRVGPDGIISTAVFPPAVGYAQPYDVDRAADGSLYIADMSQPRLRRLSPDGALTTVAGDGVWGYGGDGGPPTAAAVAPIHVTVGPDGTLYLDDGRNRRIRAISPTLPGFTNGAILIAATDGSEFYEFSPAGRHLRTVDALTGATRWTFGYGADSLLASVTDAFGNTTTMERDESGQPTAIVSPFGQRTVLAADTTGFLAQIIDPAQDSVSIGYYGIDGLLASYTDPRRNAFTVSYDSLGRFTREDDPAGGFTAMARTDSANGFEVSKSSVLGRTTTYLVESESDGSQRRVDTSPAGLVSQNVMGTDGSVTSTSPDSTVTTVVQGPDPRAGMQAGILKTMTVRLPSGLTSAVTGSRRDTLANRDDPFSLVTQTDSLVLNGRVFVNTLNAAQRTFTATTPEGRTSSGLVDSLGRVIAEVVPGVDTVKYSYDAQGRLAQTSQGSRTWRYTYDAAGLLDSVIDPLLRATTFAYDSAGRVLQQTLPDGRAVGYAYDSSGNLTSVTPPGRPAHEFTYTSVDLTASYHPPTVAEGATPTGYEYNLDRQLIRILRPDGDTLGFAYDTAGRPQGVTYQDGSLAYGYSPVGNLASVLAPAESLGLSYDGSLLTGVAWTGAVPGSVTATYDTDFRVSALAVNGNPLASFGYDDDGLLTQAGSLAIHRNALNRRIDSTALGAVTTSETYDPFGQWAIRTAAVNGTDLYRAEYTRDDLGRITRLMEVVQGDTTTFAYGYDQAGRLAEVQTNGVVSASYDYDDNGNRLSVTRPGGQESGTYDAQDRLLSYGNATYGYSKMGELGFKAEAGDTTWYHYDALGNLLEVKLPDGTDITYVVDGLNRRVGKKVNGVLIQGFLYQDQLNPVAELDGAGNVVSRFIYATRPNVPDYVIRNDTTYQIVADHLGSVRLVVNTVTGSVMQRLAYDEFGRELANTNPGFQPFGFAGGLHDPQTTLIRFGSRDYDPTAGRWTAKDPGLFGGGLLGLYTYVGSDPVNLSDPSGLLFGGLINAGECAGASAAMSWAEKAAGETRFLPRLFDNTMGLFASLWTPETSDYTFETLTTFLGVGRGAPRVEFGRWGSETAPKLPHFHWGSGPGLQSHHLPYQMEDWMRNLSSLVGRGLAGNDLANIGLIGAGGLTALLHKLGLGSLECGCGGD